MYNGDERTEKNTEMLDEDKGEEMAIRGKIKKSK